MFAVVQTGGKQYRVTVGQSIEVEKLPGEKGAAVEFNRVLLLADGDRVTAGAPLVAGARVLGSVSRQGRGRKILVFRYKSKKRVRVRRGHRQSFTQVFIRDIVLHGQSLVRQEAATGAPSAAESAAEAPPESEPAALAGAVASPSTEGED